MDRTCRVGVHGRNDLVFHDPDYAIIRDAKIETIKMMSQTSVDVFKRLKEQRSDIELITRLYDDRFGIHGHPSPEEFADRMVPVMEELQPYSVKFEVHNEPNHMHRYEGWGDKDEDAKSFNDWFLRVYEILKSQCPWAQLGFPGLAIPHRDLEWVDLCRPAVEKSDWLGVHCYWQTPPDQMRNHLADFWGLRFKYYHEKFPDKIIDLTEVGNSNVQDNIRFTRESHAREFTEYLTECFNYPYLNSASSFIMSSPDPTWDGFCWRNEGGEIYPIVEAVRDMRRPPLVPARGTRTVTPSLAQSLRSDINAGDDLLGIKAEVEALAETLLLRDLEPPICVGVLGGWGSGKSFVMHLIKQKMTEIRTQPVERGWPEEDGEGALSPYVGHIYQIDFNAWTYAKSDLWASLMQTIFFELNRQLTLEQQLQETLKEMGSDLKAGGTFWDALNQMGEVERQTLLKSGLQTEVFIEWQQGEAKDSLWEILQKFKQNELDALKTSQQDLVKKQAELHDRLKAIEHEINQERIKEAHMNAWAPLMKLLSGWVWQGVQQQFKEEIKKATSADDVLNEEELKEIAANFQNRLEQIRPTGRDLRKLVKERWGEFVPVILFVVLALTLSWLATSAYYEEFKRLFSIGSLTSLLASFVPLAMAIYKMFQRWHGVITNIQAAYEAEVAAENQKLAETMQEKLESRQREETKALRTEIDELEVQIQRQKQRVGMTANYVSLYDFVQSRIDEGGYESYLGLMHQVQRDLQELTDGLWVHPEDVHAAEKRNLFPRGSARVILYIDDLDRCPPKRVVEILEAVQLLLKTRLFVVLLGVDTRYVTRALEKEYTGILHRHGEPSGLDYIEKIIQIPYQVQPIQPGALNNYLQAQMDVVLEPVETNRSDDLSDLVEETVPVAADPSRQKLMSSALDNVPSLSPFDAGEPETIILPPEVIKFSREEYRALELACQKISNLSPRSIKRLVNVFKLMKIFWHRGDQEKSPQVVQTIADLLVLAARYPEIMREAFSRLEIKYRQELGANQDTSLSYTTFFEEFIARSQNFYLQREKESFANDIAAMGFDHGSEAESGLVTLADVEFSTFNIVRAFSFVGDASYEGSDWPEMLPPTKLSESEPATEE